MDKYLLKFCRPNAGLVQGKEYEAVLDRGIFRFRDEQGRERYRTKTKLTALWGSYRTLTTTPEYEVL